MTEIHQDSDKKQQRQSELHGLVKVWVDYWVLVNRYRYSTSKLQTAEVLNGSSGEYELHS